MQILFIHQNFPGQFLRLADALGKVPGVQVVGLGETKRIRARGMNFSYQVAGYQPNPFDPDKVDPLIVDFARTSRRGLDVAIALQELRHNGLNPDVIIGHPGWGEMLFVRDVFPRARIISYFEFLYGIEGRDVGFDPEYPIYPDQKYVLRMRNTIQLHALSASDSGISPTHWQRSVYPLADQRRISVIHEGIETDIAKPDINAHLTLRSGKRLDRSVPVVTYVCRNLEPHRGFHVFMRALPKLQQRLRNAEFVIVGGDEVSYSSPPRPPFANYREQMMAEVGTQLDINRVHFTGTIPYNNFISLMQITRLHIYFTCPFVLSWSMLEAMSCAAPVLGSNTPPVREFIRDGENGLMFDFFDQAELLDKAEQVFIGKWPEIGPRAAGFIRDNYSFRRYSVPSYLELLGLPAQ